MNFSKILDYFYPPMCGICGKLDSNFLCKKCEKILESHEEQNIVKVENMNFEELIYIFKYEGIIRENLLKYKFEEKSYLYKTFVNFLLKNDKIFENMKNYDTIIPVPISKKRDRQRGYNQSFLIAKEISKYTNLKLINNCLFKTKNVIEQSKLTKEEREQNIKNVYSLKNGDKIESKKILLIDDIYTTGSTVNECCRILKKANPKKIGVMVLAKD